MSAAHRSLARLPLEIFTDLRTEHHDDPEALRNLICSKLKQTQTRQGKTTEPITTVGKLLTLSSPALLRTLDPLLAHGAFVCIHVLHGLFCIRIDSHQSLLSLHTYDHYYYSINMIVECQELIRRISLSCAPSPISALDLFNDTTVQYDQRHHLPTGMQSLDKCLRGGFRSGTISELVGRAGVGKSQLALQLCIMAAKYGQGSVYIDTETKLSLGRLEEMAQERYCSCGGMASQRQQDGGEESFSYGAIRTSSLLSATQGIVELASEPFHGVNHDTAETPNFPFKTTRQVLANVTVHKVDNTSQLLSVVQGLEEEVLFRNQQAQDNALCYPVSLVVLDSIAAPTRREFGSERAPQRVSAILQLAQILKRLAHELQLVIVVINQVGLDDTNKNGEETSSHALRDGTDFVSVKAALGTAWSHCLSTRLFLQHERDPHCLNSNITVDDDSHENISTENDQDLPAWRQQHERGRVRKATVVKSNVAGNESMYYEIGVAGVNEILRRHEE